MDEIVTKHLSKPVVTHILNGPISIYLAKKYTPNKYVAVIRSHCSKTDTKHYLMRKYKWTSKTIDNIEWNISRKIIDRLSQAKRKTTIKFAHRWLSSGSKNYSEPMICPHCKKRDSSETDHDHFLTCYASKIQKEQRLADFKLLVTSMKTPNETISILHKGIS